MKKGAFRLPVFVTVFHYMKEIILLFIARRIKILTRQKN